jgi:hypothetical protein
LGADEHRRFALKTTADFHTVSAFYPHKFGLTPHCTHLPLLTPEAAPGTFGGAVQASAAKRDLSVNRVRPLFNA